MLCAVMFIYIFRQILTYRRSNSTKLYQRSQITEDTIEPSCLSERNLGAYAAASPLVSLKQTSCAARWPPQYAPAPADRRPTCLQI